jgi:exodeoxyribonuclease V alpha subunit
VRPLWAELQALVAAGRLPAIDLHFARFVARLDGRDDPHLVLAAVVVSQLAAAGHVCADLRALAGQPIVAIDPPGSPVPVAPALAPWVAALRASSVVGQPGEIRPLVLDDAGRLYLHRLWAAERCVADALRARAAAVPIIDHERLRNDLAAVFPGTSPERPDWQRIAAAVAVLQRFCVIAGGPGTGKTSTVVRVLLLLARQQPSPLRIALAAPTGKAASRLLDAVQTAAAALPSALRAGFEVPAEARTLHRLLGRPPREGELPTSVAADVVVVDEASMVDVSLMARLVRALPADARLILLGDKDQLASVEAGAVLADVCGPTAGCSAASAGQLAPLVGEAVPSAVLDAPAPLQDSIVLLRHSHRFGPNSGIGQLAEAVNGGASEVAQQLLTDAACPDVRWQPTATPRALGEHLGAAVDAYVAFAEAVRTARPPSDVFTQFNAFRVLCAVRHGPFGVVAVNDRISRALAERGLLDPHTTWFPGRPVLVTQNDYAVRVFNGDIGIALLDDAGRLRVCFDAGAGSVRWIAPVRLPEHETVFAMTVHKAQGSEFDAVTIILPPDGGRGLTRELLYTAITRARRQVTLCGAMDVVRATIARRAVRSSGLRATLWGTD